MKTGRRAVVLVSFEQEIERFKKILHEVHHRRVRGTKIARGSLGEREVHLICPGIGESPGSTRVHILVEYLQSLLGDLEFLVSTGICGGLSPSLRCGDLVVANKVFYSGIQDISGLQRGPPPKDIPESAGVYGLLCSALSQKPYQIVRGTAVTVEKPLLSSEEKSMAERETGSVSVDMEDFHRLTTARKLGIPFVSIRAVYDEAKEDLPESPGKLDRGKLARSTVSIADALGAVMRQELNFT